MIKTCPMCGEKFETTRSRQKYCSKLCSMRSRYNNPTKRTKDGTRVCAVCGKRFHSGLGDYKYCSDECRDKFYAAYKGKLHPRECIVCGKKYLGMMHSKYCSVTCARKAMYAGYYTDPELCKIKELLVALGQYTMKHHIYW